MDNACSSVIAKLTPLITHQESLKRLLHSQGQDAQELLDLFQWLLDQAGLDEQLRKHVTVSAQRISAKTGLYPICHELKDGIEHATQAGAGGQSDIYKGSYQGRCVCIKVMRVFETMDKELVLKHFWKEAILWRQLSHLNILPVYGIYRFQDRPCLVAPWMKNGNISKYLKDNPEVLRLPLAAGVARGLNYLHDKGIIHGDLKGSNVLVDDSGTARVADFGISSISDPEIITLTSHSGAASKGGTVRWQAPELMDMHDDLVMKNSKPSDAYAWACVCYEIFTGRIPLDHLQNDAAVIYHVAVNGARPSPPPSSSLSWTSWGLTEQIWSIMEECWKAEPRDRPTMSFVLNQLYTSVLSSAPDTQFSPHCFRESMTKSLSKSQIMSTMVLEKLMLERVVSLEEEVGQVRRLNEKLKEHVKVLEGSKSQELESLQTENQTLLERIDSLEACRVNESKTNATTAEITISRLEQEIEHLQDRYDALLVVKERAAERYKLDYARWKKVKEWMFDEDKIEEGQENEELENVNEEEKKRRLKKNLKIKKRMLVEIEQGDTPAPSPFPKPPPIGGIENKENQTPPRSMSAHSQSPARHISSLRNKVLDPVTPPKPPSSSPNLFNEGSLSRSLPLKGQGPSILRSVNSDPPSSPSPRGTTEMKAGDCECCRDYYEAVGPIPKRLQAPLWRSPQSTPAKSKSRLCSRHGSAGSGSSSSKSKSKTRTTNLNFNTSSSNSTRARQHEKENEIPRHGSGSGSSSSKTKSKTVKCYWTP